MSSASIWGRGWDLASYEYLLEPKLYGRMVERVRLGQGSDEVVGEVERLTVDATGLGIVVSEDLRRLREELYPVVITGGFKGKYRDGFYLTPRTELLIGVQEARGPRFETLGQHDDLVFALALALSGVRMRTLPVVGEAVRRRVESNLMR